MAGVYNASIINFVPTLLVDHPRLGRVRMNATSYDPATCGEIIEGPTMPSIAPGYSDSPLKNPRVDDDGNAIADQCSAMHRA